MAIPLWHHWNDRELLYFCAQIYVDLEKKVHAMEHWDFYRVCHFDIYIYVYNNNDNNSNNNNINIYIYARVFMCKYISTEKDVLDEHPFASYFWSGWAAGSALAQTPDMDCAPEAVQITRCSMDTRYHRCWGYWDFRCTAWLHGWFFFDRLKVSWWLEPQNFVPQFKCLQLGSQNFQGKAAAHSTDAARRKWMSAPKRIWLRRTEGTLHWVVELSGLRGLYYSKTPCSYVEYIVVLSGVAFFCLMMYLPYAHYIYGNYIYISIYIYKYLYIYKYNIYIYKYKYIYIYERV